jgi:hypothetical protein
MQNEREDGDTTTAPTIVPETRGIELVLFSNDDEPAGVTVRVRRFPIIAWRVGSIREDGTDHPAIWPVTVDWWRGKGDAWCLHLPDDRCLFYDTTKPGLDLGYVMSECESLRAATDDAADDFEIRNRVAKEKRAQRWRDGRDKIDDIDIDKADADPVH